MESRLDYYSSPLAAKVLKHLVSASKVLADSALPHTIQHLVEIRASQVNGCGFCTDMHTKEATHAGSPQLRRARTTDENGRGLFLVGQLSRRWGVRSVSGGKVVWAEANLAPGVPKARACEGAVAAEAGVSEGHGGVVAPGVLAPRVAA